MSTPAEKVIEVCGGFQAVADLCRVDVSRVYRWTYPPERGGTGGLIPTRQQEKLLSAAGRKGIPLRPEHFFTPTKAQETARA